VDPQYHWDPRKFDPQYFQGCGSPGPLGSRESGSPLLPRHSRDPGKWIPTTSNTYTAGIHARKFKKIMKKCLQFIYYNFL
jgi:hypothetical protein